MIPRISRDTLGIEARAPEHRRAFRAYLSEDYDGLGQFARISLSRSSVSSGIRARVPAGDFAANGRIPAGTPVVCYSRRGYVEIIGLGAAREPGLSPKARMTPTIVQQATGGTGSITGETIILPVAATAGNLLILTVDQDWAAWDRPRVLMGGIYYYFTEFLDGFDGVQPPSGDPGGGPNYFPAWRNNRFQQLGMYYKIAAGGEQTIEMVWLKSRGILYEISGADDPAVFEVLHISNQTDSTKSMGVFTSPGDLQIARWQWEIDYSGWTLDPAYTQDETGTVEGGVVSNGRTWVAAHGSSGAAARIDGASSNWCGMAIGIPGGYGI